jgi:hypothetical protein
MSSAWPACTALGIALLLFGVIGGPAFGAAGLVFVVLGIAGWVAQIRAEVVAEADGAEGHDVR